MADPYIGLRDDWEHTEGVVDAAFAYGPDRYTTGLPTAPGSGVKVRPGNPTQNQIAVAASTFGYKVTDRIFTIWSNTLRETPADPTSTAITPIENDHLTADGAKYIIKWVKIAVSTNQFVVYCQKSTLATGQ